MPRGRKQKTKEMKRANGTGSIKKLSGNRRNPYVVLITTSYEFNEDTLQKKQIQTPLGYYHDRESAQQALNAYISNPYDINTDKVTFSDIYEEWSKRQYQEWDSSTSRTYISAYNHSKPLHQMIFKTITITNMKDVINNASVGVSTKGRMKSLYNLMYDFAVESGASETNIARKFLMKGIQKKIEKERVSKKPFTEEDQAKLWNNAEYGFTKMVLIGIYSGWRPDELSTLERNNVDLVNDIMKGGMKTEAGTDRTIPIHPKIKCFVEYYYSQSDGCKFLFNDFDGQQGTFMTYDKYRGRFKKIMQRLNLEGYTPHCTRHTFITKAKDAKMDEYAIKMIVGHEIDDITEKIYTHRDDIAFMKEEIIKIK